MEFWKLNLKEIGILKIWVLKIRFKNWNFGKLVENRNFGQLSVNGIFIKIKYFRKIIFFKHKKNELGFQKKSPPGISTYLIFI